jgi:branched-chain amino acid transport system permease protein
MNAVDAYLRAYRLRWWELLPFALAIGAYFGFEDYLALGSQVLIMILFALSLD